MNREYQYPVAWHDPINGDTDRLAADAAAWMRMMCPQPCEPTAARLSVTRQEES